jgi:hypothetical protein
MPRCTLFAPKYNNDTGNLWCRKNLSNGIRWWGTGFSSATSVHKEVSYLTLLGLSFFPRRVWFASIEQDLCIMQCPVQSEPMVDCPLESPKVSFHFLSTYIQLGQAEMSWMYKTDDWIGEPTSMIILAPKNILFVQHKYGQIENQNEEKISFIFLPSCETQSC